MWYSIDNEELQMGTTSLARALEEMKKLSNKTSKDISKDMGVEQSYFSQYESGRRENIQLETLEKLMNVLGYDVTISLTPKDKNTFVEDFISKEYSKLITFFTSEECALAPSLYLYDWVNEDGWKQYEPCRHYSLQKIKEYLTGLNHFELNYFLEEAKETFLTKHKLYATETNPIHNFEQGAELCIDTAINMPYYWASKHMIVVDDYLIRNKDISQESMLESCKDIINYVILQHLIMAEQANKD